MYDIAVFGAILSVVVGGTAAAWLLSRYDPGSSAFVLGLFLLITTVWASTHIGTLLTETLKWQLLFTQLSYIGVAIDPVLWLVFAIRYTDHDEWLSKRRIALLGVVPAITLTAVFTTQYHGLFYSDMWMAAVAGQPILRIETGPLYLLNVVYSYILLLAGTGLLARMAVSDNRLYRRQSAVLIVCITVPWVVNMTYHLGIRPIPWVDPTPMAFILVSVALAVLVVRTDLASFLPVAHERVFRTLDDPIVVAAPAGRVIDANDAARATLGDGDPIEGAAASDVLPDELVEGESLRSDLDGPVECTVEHDGDAREYLARRQQVDPDRDAGSRGYLVALTDITERKERERDLERKNDLLDEFAGVVSHDVATPLTLIENKAQLIQMTGDPDHAEDIYEATRRVQTLVDELRDLAQQGKQVGETAPVEIETVIHSAWDSVAPSGATLIVESSTSVEADRDRLRQLLGNLFENAVEHAGPDVTVRAGVTAEGFYVADDGPGIPADDRDRVFEQGVTTDADGSGLGLAIVRRIVEGHGWEIAVTASDEGGARFEVTGVTVHDADERLRNPTV